MQIMGEKIPDAGHILLWRDKNNYKKFILTMIDKKRS